MRHGIRITQHTPSPPSRARLRWPVKDKGGGFETAPQTLPAKSRNESSFASSCFNLGFNFAFLKKFSFSNRPFHFTPVNNCERELFDKGVSQARVAAIQDVRGCFERRRYVRRCRGFIRGGRHRKHTRRRGNQTKD